MVAVYDGRFSNRHRQPAVAVNAPFMPRARREGDDAQIAALRRTVSEQRGQIALLKRQTARRDATIARLKAELNHRGEAAQARLARLAEHAGVIEREQKLLGYIIEIVGRFAGLSLAELRGNRKARLASWPRQMACFLARERCPHLSLPQIGLALMKDHTTVMHACKAVPARLAAGCAQTRALLDLCLPEVKGVQATLEKGVGDGQG